MFLRSNAGWIGVDRGSTSVKAAQLRLVGDKLELSAAAITPRWTDESDSIANRCRSECEALRALAPSLCGRRCAAVLSMRDCALESISKDDPRPGPSESYDFWDTDAENGYLIKTSSDSVESLCNGMGKAGFHCCVVDGAPTALARALSMSHGVKKGEIVGGLDLGANGAMLVVSQDGIARYAREVSEVGLNQYAEALPLSRPEAERQILKHGVGASGESIGPYCSRLEREVKPLLDELKKSLLHLRGKLRSRGPSKYFLFGVGALIPGIADQIAETLEASVEPWTAAGLASDSPEIPPQCLLGPAIALSALAWEATT